MMAQKKVIIKSKVITDKPRCAICNSKKSEFLKQEHNIKRNTKNIDSKMLEAKNGRLMLSSKCTICGSKKSRLMKEQEAKGLLGNLVITTPLRKNPLLGDILF